MRKADEVEDPNSCLNRSQSDEPLFVLCARDVIAHEAVRTWAMRAERLGVNPEKVADARAVADAMVAWRENNGGGKVPD